MRLLTLAAVLVLTGGSFAGCTAAPVEPVAEPIRSPAEACHTPALGDHGLVLESDDNQFEAGVVGEGSTVAVLVHQSGANYCGWAQYVGVLSEHGIQSVLLNLCGSGWTECESDDTVLSGANAVIAATEWARANGATRVVAVGASLGGVVVFIAAGSENGTGIDAVADLSGPISFEGVSTTDYAAGVTVPLRFSVSDTDPVVSFEKLESLGALTASEQISIVPGVGHGWDMLFDDSGDLSEVGSSLIEFIAG